MRKQSAAAGLIILFVGERESACLVLEAWTDSDEHNQIDILTPGFRPRSRLPALRQWLIGSL